MNGTPDLSRKADLVRLGRDVRAWRPSLIVIDTLTSAWPGLEENASEAMSAVYAAAKSLTAWGAAVVILHHPTKQGNPRPRGHGALYGPLDFNLFLEREGREVTCRFTKNKQGSTERAFAFRVRDVRLRDDPDGDPVTAPLLTETGEPEKRGPKLSRSAGAALTILRGLAPGGGPVTEGDWRDAAVAGRAVSSSEDAKSRRTAFRRAVGVLVDKGLVTFDGASYRARPLSPDWSEEFSEEDAA